MISGLAPQSSLSVKRGRAKALSALSVPEGHCLIPSAHSPTPFCLFSWRSHGALPFLWNPRRFLLSSTHFCPPAMLGTAKPGEQLQAGSRTVAAAGSGEQAQGASSPISCGLPFSLSPSYLPQNQPAWAWPSQFNQDGGWGGAECLLSSSAGFEWGSPRIPSSVVLGRTQDISLLMGFRILVSE